MPRILTAGLALGILASTLTLAIGLSGALDEAELATYDWRIRTAADPASLSRDIVLVEVNDTSIRDLAPIVGRWPWPRMVFAALIDYLNRGPARVVAFDFGFWEPDTSLGVNIAGTPWSGEASDAALAASLRNARATVLLADAVYEGTGAGAPQDLPDWRTRALPFRLGPAIEERPIIVPPFDAALEATTTIAHNFLPFDPDGPARRLPPFVRQGDHYLPSLGVAAAIVGGGIRPEDVVLAGDEIRFGDRRMPLVPATVYDTADKSTSHTQLTTLINYQAPALLPDGERPFVTYEARHLLASEELLQAGEPPLVDPAVFKDKIVFVGQTTSGLRDVFTTPFGSDEGTMPGIQLHATMADNLLSGRFIRPAADGARVASVLAAGATVGLMTALLPFTAAATGTLLVVAGWSWYSLAAFERGLWLNMVQPLMTAGVALFFGTTYQYFVEGREKRLVKALFGRYVSRDVFRQLMEHPEMAALGGTRREMSVLFSDIRGFTSVTERGEPDALVAQLNEYFSRMVEVVFHHQGTVDKFVGDMVMALFGAPVEDPSHAEHAVAAAVQMVAELGDLNRRWAEEGRPQLDIGIGVNSGEMIAGNIGSSSIMSYTVIGDNVNLGARLESLNKDFGTRIIISDATRLRLDGPYTYRPLGSVVVKGKSRPVDVFEVVVASPMHGPEVLQP